MNYTAINITTLGQSELRAMRSITNSACGRIYLSSSEGRNIRFTGPLQRFDKKKIIFRSPVYFNDFALEIGISYGG